jgi:predicted enzyme related to lactoylglutathione lyase
MSARIKHVAIVSGNCAAMGRFYEAAFGLKTFPGARPDSAVAVSDGYVGLNINPRKPGRQGGFDHFGFEVDDVDVIQARVSDEYPAVQLLRRPSNRPFAGISMHDPAGNVFDLSRKGMSNRRDVYEQLGDVRSGQSRFVRHFMLRAVNPALLAAFYRDVFELQEQDKETDDPNTYLTDGVVTMVIAPWKIADFEGTGIERPALDHLGFQVESLASFRADLENIASRNPGLTPMPVGCGDEGRVRLELFSNCRYGEYHLADPDGVLIDISEG